MFFSRAVDVISAVGTGVGGAVVEDVRGAVCAVVTADVWYITPNKNATCSNDVSSAVVTDAAGNYKIASG